MGHNAVTEYCNLIIGCIQSPYVLEDICKEVLQYYNKASSGGGSAGGAVGGSGGGAGGAVTGVSGAVGGAVVPPPAGAVAPVSGASGVLVMDGSLRHHSLAATSGCGATGVAPQGMVVSLAPPADVSKLVTHVHNLYWQCIEHRLSHLAQQEWDDLVAIILAANKAFKSLPSADPNLNWNNLMVRIRNHQKCKKELWSRILAGIRTIEMR